MEDKNRKIIVVVDEFHVYAAKFAQELMEDGRTEARTDTSSGDYYLPKPHSNPV